MNVYKSIFIALCIAVSAEAQPKPAEPSSTEASPERYRELVSEYYKELMEDDSSDKVVSEESIITNTLNLCVLVIKGHKSSFGLWPESITETRFIPKDPWRQQYIYVPYTSSNGYGKVVCYGADKKEGGTGHDKDFELRFDSSGCNGFKNTFDGTNTYCDVHKTIMKPDDVPVKNMGCWDYRIKEYGEVVYDKFPNINDIVDSHTNLLLDKLIGKKKKVLFCPTCRDASDKWMKNYNATHPQQNNNL